MKTNSMNLPWKQRRLGYIIPLNFTCELLHQTTKENFDAIFRNVCCLLFRYTILSNFHQKSFCLMDGWCCKDISQHFEVVSLQLNKKKKKRKLLQFLIHLDGSSHFNNFFENKFCFAPLQLLPYWTYFLMYDIKWFWVFYVGKTKKII
jgi:hypothetical protein